MSSADYWQRTERELCGDGSTHLCPFLLFTDGSHLDNMGRFVVKVAILGSGNLRNEAQRRLKSRAILALIPELKVSKAMSRSIHIVRARRHIHHTAIDTIMQHLKARVLGQGTGVRLSCMTSPVMLAHPPRTGAGQPTTPWPFHCQYQQQEAQAGAGHPFPPS